MSDRKGDTVDVSRQRGGAPDVGDEGENERAREREREGDECQLKESWWALAFISLEVRPNLGSIASTT